MSETGNIETLAKLVSQDIFKWFKWGTCAPKDEDWSCESDHHGKNTHPSDVVFFYEDPYTGQMHYLNTDLKSYAAGSITKASITRALKTLAMSVECANISDSWQSKFLLNDVGFGDVSGMLFIYNHDSEYDKNFQAELEKVEIKDIPVADGNELVVVGPDLIRRLCDVVSDMKMLKAEDLFPSHDDYTFFYPDLIRARRCGDEWGKPATIEALTSPWLIIKHRSSSEFKGGFIIYYHEYGDTVDEFIYLIDAMSHYQMLSSDYSIRVRFTAASSHANVNFEKAKYEYLKMWGNDEGRKKQMDSLEVQRITNFTKSFNPMEIGMREDV
ncbi:hypothetical protein [Marinomonas gallaica]|uniref:hypothetical protein n=1 Tax=Marinomonas gallaica TaxID=1806667 RepID=UPI0008349E1A|nr:hypothetical protein [Marinomonas gallaica]